MNMPTIAVYWNFRRHVLGFLNVLHWCVMRAIVFSKPPRIVNLFETSRERAGIRSSEHWSVSKMVASNAAAESKHCFIRVPYWSATWTACIERRVCFLRASWRFHEQRIFCYYDIMRWMLWGKVMTASGWAMLPSHSKANEKVWKYEL